MDKREITCIVCPIGCKILATVDGTNIKKIEGYKCKRGVEYTRSEILDPRRVLTSSISVINGEWLLVSVKTSKPVPKDKVFDILRVTRKTKAKAPVNIGQTLIKDVAGTGIDIVATRSVNTL